MTEDKSIISAMLNERAMWSTALQEIPVAIIICDEHRTMISVNKQASLLFGYPLTDMIGKNVSELVPPQLREQHEKGSQAYLREPIIRPLKINRILKGLKKNDEIFPVEISLTPFVTTEGSFIAVVLMAHPSTPEKRDGA
jgi:two-component system sensor kinase FixL